MRDYFKMTQRYAQDVVIEEGGEKKAAKAFIQPLSISSPENEGRATPMGMADDRRYLLITAADAINTGENALISCGDRVYSLLRCELMGGGSHWEGIMKLKAGAENVW
ncbi:MAG: hypothetical protein IJV74_03405 [Clostridia bacterium]|nr:hypothetical protein [Oscillospiraceae bacterium]MBQ9733263.1 hypothetical protein [Clostridia bacterium]